MRADWWLSWLIMELQSWTSRHHGTIEAGQSSAGLCGGLPDSKLLPCSCRAVATVAQLQGEEEPSAEGAAAAEVAEASVAAGPAPTVESSQLLTAVASAPTVSVPAGCMPGWPA